MTSKNQLAVALNDLLRSDSDDAFVIIADEASRRLVQFGGGTEYGLHFDLPSRTLSSEEMARAKAVLADYGISIEEWHVFDRPGGEVVAKRSGFLADLGDNVERAVELTWRVLTEVYDFDQGRSMRIKQN